MHPKAQASTSPFLPSFYAGPAYGKLSRLSFAHLGVSSNCYVHMEELQLLDHPPSPSPPHTLPWPHYTTFMVVQLLVWYLLSHPDSSFVSSILRGLTIGFHLGYYSARTGLQSTTRNHPSSLANQSVVTEYIHEEVFRGRMVEPRSLYFILHVSQTQYTAARSVWPINNRTQAALEDDRGLVISPQ